MSVLPSPREPPLHSPLSPSSTGSVTLPHTARPRHTPVLSHGYNTVVAVHLQGLQETLDSVKVEWEGQTGHSGDKVGLADLTGLTRTDTAPRCYTFSHSQTSFWPYQNCDASFIFVLPTYSYCSLISYFRLYTYMFILILYSQHLLFIYLAKGNKFLPS